MTWLSEPLRLVLLIALCTLLWSLESVLPLYKYKDSRLRSDQPAVGPPIRSGICLKTTLTRLP